MTLLDEIREQPDAAARFLDRQLPRLPAIAAAARRHAPKLVLIAARGSSDHAAIYAQYVLGIRNGLPVALAAPSMFSLFAAPPRLADALVIGISQSGQSPDIVAVLEEAKRQGAPSIAITNTEGSPLADAADHVLLLGAGEERAVAATKTYTTELLAIAALSASLVRAATMPSSMHVQAEAELRAVPAAIAVALQTEDAARDRAGRLAWNEPRAIVLGRGFEYGTAREIALKLQELAQVLAHAWSSSDFEHGPLALLEPGFPVIAIVSDDVAGAALVPLLHRLRDEHGADLVVLSRRADTAAFDPLPLPAGAPAWLAPISSIVPGQLLAYHLARARGLDTEHPRAIAKVTRTR
ncbi:MAG TPA: SIS domain-containing protein [Candidatus Limnocylindrales bacterium]|nr:SIS domain-containing protein [Candidatus Limnocylindrales bacterium]